MTAPRREPHHAPPGAVEGSHLLEGPFGDVALVDLVNRVLDRGVVLAGDVTVSVAGVDLLHLDLRLLLSSVETLAAREGPAGGDVGPESPERVAGTRPPEESRPPEDG